MMQEVEQDLIEASPQVDPAMDTQTDAHNLLRERINELEIENAALAAKLSRFKEVVGPKLKMYVDQCAALSASIAALEAEKILLLDRIDQLQRDNSTKPSVDLLNQQNSKLNSEVDRLRQFLAEIEDSHTREAASYVNTFNEYQLQIHQLESLRDELQVVIAQSNVHQDELSLRCTQSQIDFDNSRSEFLAFKLNVSHDSKTLQNLQIVLEQFQIDKGEEILKVEAKHLAEKDLMWISCKEWEQRALKAEEDLEILRTELPRRQSVEADYQAKDLLISKLRHDGFVRLILVIQLQSHLSDAMRRMRSGDNEQQVDTALLINLIVGFVSAPRGTSKPYEALTVIANVLKFTDEDRVKVGLMRAVSVSTGRRLSGAGLRDMFVSFLEKEIEVSADAGDAETLTPLAVDIQNGKSEVEAAPAPPRSFISRFIPNLI